jgi:proteasome lid subunit RPN8/RPN11
MELGVAASLIIQPAPWRVILEHARAAYPEECCGILLGSPGPEAPPPRSVHVAVPCRNAHPGDRRRRFLIDYRDQLAAQKRARAEGLEILGFFHSHANGPAYFSATDLAEALPRYSNLVVSYLNGRFQGAASFRVDAARTQAELEPLEYPALAASLLFF